VSLAVVCYTGLLVVAARALAPAVRTSRLDPELRAAVARSDDSLAYFAVRDDRLTVRVADTVISYAVRGGVAVAAGDPLGPPAQWPAAVAGFLEEVAADGRVAAVMGCGGVAARVYVGAGLHAVYLGDEAVLDLEPFSLEGRAVRIARQSWNRARRAGYTSDVRRSGELEGDNVREMLTLSQRWRGEAAERGFSMALNRLFDPRDADTILVIARDGERRVRGFLHFVPWGRDGASLDAMRRDRAAPSWLNDFLVVEAARRLPQLGVRRMSLNFSFLRAVLDATHAQAPVRLRVAQWVLRRLSGPFQIETLYRFNKKFAPRWQPRYGCLEAVGDLPRLALAVMALEGLITLPALALPRRQPRTTSPR
jgi:lysyl-tRNA synthetase class 2